MIEMTDSASKFQSVKSRFDAIEQEMSRPETLSAQQKFMELSKERSHLAPVVEKIARYNRLVQQIKDNQGLIESDNDEELKAIALDEMKSLTAGEEELRSEIELMLIPPHKYEGRNVIVEIRAGTGGNEASLFAGDLYRMYMRYAESRRWKVTLLDSHPSEVGGLKEASFSVEGPDSYTRLQFESGVHRVQRVPTTEASGRIHTSAVSVVVMPEPEPIEINIEEKDIRVDVFRSSGPGGQSVNTTDSAVRITHLPTGIMVQCQDEKSQRRNKEKALRHLRAKLLEAEETKEHSERSSERKSQIGSGDRSEKIRTYNFPQNRVTDHRIGLTLHALSSIIDGNLDELVKALLRKDLEKRLQEQAF
jgi:peptide chain release factor 1